MAKYLVYALLTTLAYASPIEERDDCGWLDEIVSIMHMQPVATPFCSSMLSISTVTKTATVTSTPPCKTITSEVQSTSTVTTVSTSWVYGTLTVYPVVAVSTTSTCALGATVVPSSPAPTKKRNAIATSWRGYTPPPLGTPKCLTSYHPTSVNPACSCLSIPTPTTLSITTVTLPTATITKVIAETPASVTVTSVVTSTSFTSTYSATQYYTSTFTILPSPTTTTLLPDGEVYGIYNNLDFPGMDIVNFFCYKGGPAPPSPYPACASFSDCVAECGFYNDNRIGASTNTTCGTVTYNAPADGSSGSCYLKTGQVGCGSANTMTNSSVLLPLQANDVQ